MNQPFCLDTFTRDTKTLHDTSVTAKEIVIAAVVILVLTDANNELSTRVVTSGDAISSFHALMAVGDASALALQMLHAQTPMQ